MRLALTGGTGLVGRFLTAHFLAQGHELRLLVRPGAAPADLVGRVACVEGDLGRLPPPDWLDGCDALVHAAFAHAEGRYRGGEGHDLPAFLNGNLMGTIGLMQQAQRAGVGRAILFSSRAVYGRCVASLVLDEDHPPLPATHYGAMKMALEAFAMSFSAQEGWPVAVVRPTGIYGIAQPFARTKWLELIRAVMAERPDLPVRRSSEVHGADVAAAVALLLASPVAGIAGRVFNCSDLMVSTRDIAMIAQRATGAAGPLPAEPSDENFLLMECRRLRELGMVFGGRPLLERTVTAICARLAR